MKRGQIGAKVYMLIAVFACKLILSSRGIYVSLRGITNVSKIALKSVIQTLAVA
jgi:hypothetical protein